MSAKIANEIIDAAYGKGWKISVERNEIFRATKSFTPGDLDDYHEADSEWFSFLSKLPRTRPGSIWGTTSDGIGGYVGHKNGRYEINMSGGDKRILKAIAKELASRKIR